LCRSVLASLRKRDGRMERQMAGGAVPCLLPCAYRTEGRMAGRALYRGLVS